MCSLCGVVGGNEYSADAVVRPDVYTRNANLIERRRERINRVRIVNRVLTQFGMAISDWQGTAFLLSTCTGKTEIIRDLGHLWPVAEKLAGYVCDPLAPSLIESLERSHG